MGQDKKKRVRVSGPGLLEDGKKVTNLALGLKRSPKLSLSEVVRVNCADIMSARFRLFLEHMSPQFDIDGALLSRRKRVGEMTDARPEFKTGDFVYFSAYPTLDKLTVGYDRCPLDMQLHLSFASESFIPDDMQVRFARPIYFESKRRFAETQIDGIHLTLNGESVRAEPYRKHWAGPYKMSIYLYTGSKDKKAQILFSNPEVQFKYADALKIYLERLLSIFERIDSIKKSMGDNYFYERLLLDNKLFSTIQKCLSIFPVAEATSSKEIPLAHLNKRLIIHSPVLPKALYAGHGVIAHYERWYDKNWDPISGGLLRDDVKNAFAPSPLIELAISKHCLSEFMHAYDAIGEMNSVPYKHSSPIRGANYFFDVTLNRSEIYYYLDEIKAWVTPFIHAIIVRAEEIIHYLLDRREVNLELGIYRPGLFSTTPYEQLYSESALVVAMSYYPGIVSTLLAHGAKKRTFVNTLFGDISTLALVAPSVSSEHLKSYFFQGFSPSVLANVDEFQSDQAKLLTDLVRWYLEFPVMVCSNTVGAAASLDFVFRDENSGSEACHVLQAKRLENLGFTSSNFSRFRSFSVPVNFDSIQTLMNEIVRMCFLEYQAAWFRCFGEYSGDYSFHLKGSADYYADTHMVDPSIDCPIAFDLKVNDDLSMCVHNFKAAALHFPVFDPSISEMKGGRAQFERMNQDRVRSMFPNENHELLTHIEAYSQTVLRAFSYRDNIPISEFIMQFKEPSFEGYAHFYGRHKAVAVTLGDEFSEIGGHRNFRTLNHQKLQNLFGHDAGYVYLYDEEFQGLNAPVAGTGSAETFLKTAGNQMTAFFHPPTFMLPAFKPEADEFKETMKLYRTTIITDAYDFRESRDFYVKDGLTNFMDEFYRYIESPISALLGFDITIFKSDASSDEDLPFSEGDVFDALTGEAISVDPILAYIVIRNHYNMEEAIAHVQNDVDRIFGFNKDGASSVKVDTKTKTLMAPVKLISTRLDIVNQILNPAGRPHNLSELAWACDFYSGSDHWFNLKYEDSDKVLKPFKEHVFLNGSALWEVVDPERPLTDTSLATLQFYMALSDRFLYRMMLMCNYGSVKEEDDNMYLLRSYRPDCHRILHPFKAFEVQGVSTVNYRFTEIEDTSYFKEQQWLLLFIFGFESVVSDKPNLIFDSIYQSIMIAPSRPFFQFTAIEEPFDVQLKLASHAAWLSVSALDQFHKACLSKVQSVISDLPSVGPSTENIKSVKANIIKRANAFLAYCESCQSAGTWPVLTN